MKDDIKEILDMLKDSQYIPSDDNRTYKLLDRDDTRHLLDYITNLQKTQETLIKNDNEIITNLQEELKEVNESITWWSNRFKAVEKENTKLKQEKDKYYEENLIISQEILNLQEENIKLNIKLEDKAYKQLKVSYKKLQEENDKLKGDLECYENGVYFSSENDKLQTKIDKAISMLKELNIKLKDILKIGIDIKEISDIEEVLQGEDNE